MAKYYTIAIKNNNVMEGLNEKLEEICFNSNKEPSCFFLLTTFYKSIIIAVG